MHHTARHKDALSALGNLCPTSTERAELDFTEMRLRKQEKREGGQRPKKGRKTMANHNLVFAFSIVSNEKARYSLNAESFIKAQTVMPDSLNEALGFYGKSNSSLKCN